jgi:acetyl-CoA synthetase
MTSFANPGAIWHPSDAAIAQSNFTAFLPRLGVTTYAELQAATAADVRPFHREIVAALGLHWDRPYDTLLDLSRGKPFATWFGGGLLNAPANCLDRHIALGRGRDEALVAEGEDGVVRRFTFAELRDEVARLANALRSLGVGKGDRVGIFMPLVPEAAIGLLAIGYIGAIAVPAFSGYGEQALAARLADARAKVLLTADSSSRRGKLVDMKAAVDRALELAPTVEHVVVLRRGSRVAAMDAARDHDWRELVHAQSNACEYERTSANDPFLLLYTSGSTGKPKGA